MLKMASIGLRTAVAKNHGWLRMGLLLLVALAVFISGPRGHVRGFVTSVHALLAAFDQG